MLFIAVAFLTFLSVSHGFVCDANNSKTLNDRPVVGVLTQKYWGSFKPYSTRHSYIAASYVKYLESAGARVVPIHISRDYDYYKQILAKINGVLLPGGNNYIGNSEYSDAAVLLYNLSLEINRRNVYFPVWGTCLGFEAMLFAQSNQTDFLTKCDASDVSLPLEFTIEDPTKSKLFASVTPHLLNILAHENVTANYHRNCMTNTNFTKASLQDFFTVLSINKDVNGLEFISTIEAKKYPIYGVQFHPEKNTYEFILNGKHRNTPHSYNSILVTQYFANFFVNETRRNFNCFKTQLEENKALIFNFKPEFTGYSNKGSFDQIYFFQISSSSKEESHLFLLCICFTSVSFYYQYL